MVKSGKRGHNQSSDCIVEPSHDDTTTGPAPDLLFRDIDSVIKPFSGNDNTNIKKWISEFEKCAELFKWTELQKYFYSKRLLKGDAKAFVDFELKPFTYLNLRNGLLREFQSKVSSATVHEQLRKRKKQKEETFQEYLYNMMEIADQADVEDSSIIQYVISGIQDSEVNKVILYDAENLSELKTKLKIYEKFKKNLINTKNEQFNNKTESAKFSSKNNKNKTRHCFNCGSIHHEFYDCPDKARGPKCFRCQQFGHRGKDCNSFNKKTEHPSSALIGNRKNYCNVIMNDKNVTGLIDTGSDITIMKESDFKNIFQNVSLNNVGFTVNGLGSEVKTKGFFRTDVRINDIDFLQVDIYVVPNEVMRPQIIIGMNILSAIDLIISQGNIIMKKTVNQENVIIETQSNSDLNSKTIFDGLFVEPADLPDVSHVENKSVANEIKELISNYHPTKIHESPVRMKLTVIDEKPVYQPPRRLPSKERKFVEQQIAEWIEKGIVRPCYSDYASPIVLVKKKCGDLRLCVDYRQLNKKVYRDRYPIPVVQDQIDMLQGAKYFSTLDLANGFFHVVVEENSRRYTAFVTPDGHYEFLRMPFGLCNSPPIFQRFIVAIFRPYIQEGKALIYIDDLIIPSKSEEEGFSILKDILKTASEYGLEIKWKKCKILHKEIEFLGHVISNCHVQPSPGKTKAVMNFPEPRTKREVQSFLGLAGYFRKFIKDFAIKARPLSNLLKNDSKFTFTDEHRKSFLSIKESLSSSPVLIIFRNGATTELHTDACAYGYGAILFQVSQEDNKLHPVCFMSRKTSEIEQRYDSYKLEVLAVVEAIRKFRVYLLGQPFKLVTDCKALELTLKKRDLSTQVARWALLLDEFEYTVEHRSGSRLKHVDALSRNPIVMFVLKNETMSKQLQVAQQGDEHLQAIFEVLAHGPYKDYVINNSLLCKYADGQMLYVVPQALEDDIIRKIHSQGHYSYRKMQEIISKEFAISQLKPKIERCIRNCVSCILASRKEGKAEGLLHPVPKGEEPLDTFHIDHLGPMTMTSKGYKYLLSIIDGFTKFIWLFPVKSLTADEALAKLKVVINIFGSPRRMVADRGGAFISKEFRAFCDLERIQLIHITTGVPRGNGQVERSHRIVIATLSKLALDDPPTWFKHVSRVQNYINSTYQRSICMSPFRLLTGVNMRLKDDLPLREIIEREAAEMYHEARDEMRAEAKANILKIQEENRKTFNKRRKQPKRYKVGDLVAIERTQFGTAAKIRPKFLGPYEITSTKKNYRYDLKKVGEHEGPMMTASSVDKMKPWSTPISVEDQSSEADDPSDGREL